MRRNKMKKSIWLCSALAVVSLSLGCAAAFPASAEGALAVGSLSGSSATVTGTPDGKTKASWSAGGAYLYTTVSDYNNEDITVKITPGEDTAIRIALVQKTEPWEAILRYDVTTAEAGMLYTAQMPGNAENEPGNYDLCIYLDESVSVSSEKSAIVEEITVGNVSYTPTPYTEPEEPTDRVLADYTEWTGSSNVTVAQNEVAISNPEGIVDGIGSVRFSALDAGKYTDVEGEEHAAPVYVKIPVTGVPTGWGTLYIKMKKSAGIGTVQAYVNGIPDSDPALNAAGDGVYVCSDIESSWNVTLSPSSPDGYMLSAVSMGDYLDGVTAKHDLYLVIEFTDEAVAENEVLDFGGIVWSASSPDFATDEQNLPVTIGEFTNGDSASQYTIVNNPEPEGDIPGGLVKVSYETSTSRKFIKATVTNVKETMTRLVIEYYTTSGEEVNFGVYFDGSSVQGYKWFPSGDGAMDIELSGKVPSGAFELRIYIDRAGQNDEAVANTVVIKSVRFAEPLEIGEIGQDAGRFTIEETGEGTEISWPQKLGSNYNAVIIPVSDWMTCDRFLKLVFTAEKDFVLAVYAGNSNTVLGHTSYKAGVTHTVYVDMSKASTPLQSGDIQIYLFIDATGDSLENKMTLKEIAFVKEGIQAPPSASALTIDFEAETVSFEGEIEVFATKEEDGTLSDPIASGTAVTPGSTLWMRTKAGDSQAASEAVEFAVPARPQIAALTPDTVTDSTIVFNQAGYSFKLGDGQWTTDGNFSDLDPETEYPVTVRLNATSSAFASEEVTFTVTTLAEQTIDPGDSSDSSSDAGNTGGSQSVNGGTSSGGCGSVFAGIPVTLLFGAAAFVLRKKSWKDD